jgi:hypothetical protein
MQFDAVHLVGTGGTGSILLEPLIRLLTYHPNGTTNIILHDKDHFTSSNSTRQLFDPEYLGENKAVALANRYEDIAPTLIAYDEYLNYDRLSQNLEDHCVRSALVILTVDRDMVRHNLVKALDDSSCDFACILPGNEFRTASCVIHQRVNGVCRFPHPFDVVSNYHSPEDTEPGACGEVSVDRPQLICANFASACMTLDVVYSLLEDEPLPFRINYDGRKKDISIEGRFIGPLPT